MSFSRKEAIIIIIVVLSLSAVTLATKFYGGADILDYADSAKFFSESYSAKLRSSHSLVYGLLHAPIVGLTESFIAFKITSLTLLLLLTYSVYVASNRNKKAFFLMLFSPIVWYMAPWISPIQAASLLFFWGYVRMNEFLKTKSVKSIIYAGLLIGFSWALWDGILFFIPLLAISFLYNKKLIYLFYLLGAIIIGVLPRLIIDQYLLGFAFLGILRHIFASLNIALYGGIYGQGSLVGISKFIITILFIPFYTYLLFTKKVFKENKETAIFLILATILIIFNSQIRFTLIIVPIIILTMSKYITKKKLIIQLAIFLILSIVAINPYILQIKYQTNFEEFSSIPLVYNNFQLNKEFSSDLIKQDLLEISKDYPNETFIAGNNYENYRIFANRYWGKEIKEIVSIEDYQLNISSNKSVFEKEYCSHIKISERRDFCAVIYIRKAFNDATNYSSIKYAISDTEEINLNNFKFVKKYKLLSLFEKSNN